MIFSLWFYCTSFCGGGFIKFGRFRFRGLKMDQNPEDQPIDRKCIKKLDFERAQIQVNPISGS